MKTPNLFSYATSELSQDAFLCWILAWAHPKFKSENPRLQACGEAFLRDMLAQKGITLDTLENVDVRKQDQHIDVLCIVNGIYSIIIEDKTNTSSHGDQLERYIRQMVGKHFDMDHIVPIYYKTSDQSHYDQERKMGYFPYTRRKALDILIQYNDGSHAILNDYTCRLQEIESWTQSYSTLPIDKWGWHSWIGFYKALQERIEDSHWKYVPNPSGGFLGMWCFWIGDIFMQLEQEKLCLKVETTNKSDAKSVRQSLLQKALALSDSGYISIRKPDRMSAGKYTTFAIAKENYRKVDFNGRVDMDATTEFVREAGKLVQALAKEYHGN